MVLDECTEEREKRMEEKAKHMAMCRQLAEQAAKVFFVSSHQLSIYTVMIHNNELK
jgi:preprotein translocase subunit SecE